MKEVYPVKSYAQNTPTEAFKTFVKATINKDVEGAKKTLSNGSLEFIQESAEAQNVTVDAILLHENESSLRIFPR